MDTTWVGHRNYLVTIWVLLGDSLSLHGTTWGLHAHYIFSIWAKWGYLVLPGDYLATFWWLLGDSFEPRGFLWTTWWFNCFGATWWQPWEYYGIIWWLLVTNGGVYLCPVGNIWPLCFNSPMNISSWWKRLPISQVPGNCSQWGSEEYVRWNMDHWWQTWWPIIRGGEHARGG